MARRFNSPPNWPPAPSDWKPFPGWEPDPAWGPAPEGWNFWIEDRGGTPAELGAGPDAVRAVGAADIPSGQQPEATTPRRAAARDAWLGQLRSIWITSLVWLRARGQAVLTTKATRNRWVRGAALVAGGLVCGGVVGFLAQPPVTSSKEYLQLNSELDRQTSNVMIKDATARRLQAQIDAMSSRQSQLDAKEKTLAGKEADLAAREQKLAQAQKQVADGQVRTGLHVVGKDVQPGLYKTDGPDGTNSVGCYYAWKTGTGSDAAIKDNNIVKGTATVTLIDGETFESKSCMPWTKIG